MLLIDFESQSECPIGKGTDNYASHPSTNILCMSYGFSGEEPLLWLPGQVFKDEIISYLKDGGLIGASNAPFDKALWEFIAVPEHGFPELKPEQWYCTQAQSRVAGLPSSLDNSARATKQPLKLSSGSSLISKCCIPPYSKDPQDYIDLGDYCLQDWIVMDAVYQTTPKLMNHLQDDWLVNEIVNERGIKIDRDMAEAATRYAEAERSEIAGRLVEITDGDVEKPTQHIRFKNWLLFKLEDAGCEAAIKLMTRVTTDKETKEKKIKHSADKTVRANLLADPDMLDLPGDVVEGLQCMDDAGGSATAKFGKMAKLASDDDRVRGAIRCFGAASTLRYSSLGLQVHNFRRDAFSPDEARHYRELLLTGEILTDIEGKPVPVMDTLGRLLRSAIIPEPGNVLVVADWAAVESRMTAYLAGDTKKLNLFRKGGDPYIYAAEGIYPGQEIDSTKRQIGKVTDLACGFLGGPGALAAMASQYRIYIPEAERESIVQGWRASHPKIVKLGDRLMATAITAMRDVGVWHDAGPCQYIYAGDGALYCKLPDGQTMLRYPDAKIEMTEAPWGDMVPSITALKAAFKPKAGEEWPRHALWRGLLLENLVQSSCAIMLRNVVYQFQDNCIFHVHDEVVLEVPDNEADDWADELEQAMETSPNWAPDLPLKAPADLMTRYGK